MTTSRPRRRKAAAARPVRKRAPRHEVAITDAARSRIPRAFLSEVAAAALEVGGRPGLPVSLLLTDDAGISVVHAEHLDDPTATDVISFDLDDSADLVVSVETAARIAAREGHRMRDEVALYVIHGLLHVCGHDDHAARARARMRRAELEVLQRLGLRVAPVDA